MAKQEVRNWAKELEDAAVDAAAAAPAVSGDFIGTEGGVLTYRGAQVPGNEMEVCIVDFTNANMLYEGVYSKANPTPPICYAFGKDKASMKPHPASPKPQCADCESCPMNQWGTAATGKGKACQNTVRLALVPAAAVATVMDEDTAFLKVPVTSVKSFSTLVQQYSQMLKRPPFAMTSFIKGIPGSPFHLVFRAGSTIEDGDTLASIMDKRQLVTLDFPFPAATPASAEAKPAPRANNRFARK